MPVSSWLGCSTRSPMVPSRLMWCTVKLDGLLWATSRNLPDMSTLAWIGRDESLTGSPRGLSAPVAWSIAKALATWTLPVTSPAAGPPLLDTTYRYFFDGCGHAYWMLAGVDTVVCLES